jgi:hypothetical protein
MKSKLMKPFTTEGHKRKMKLGAPQGTEIHETKVTALRDFWGLWAAVTQPLGGAV